MPDIPRLSPRATWSLVAGLGLFAALVLVVTLVLGFWQWFLIAESVVVAAFAAVYAAFYSAKAAFWSSLNGWHLELSMLAITLVMGSFAAVTITGNMDAATPAGMVFTLLFVPLPLTQAWRMMLLVVSARAARKKPPAPPLQRPPFFTRPSAFVARSMAVVLLCLAVVLVAVLKFGLWFDVLFAETTVAALFASFYSLRYAFRGQFRESWTGWHLEISMVSITVALCGFAVVVAAHDVNAASISGRLLTLAFFAQPFLQAWRLSMLVITDRRRKRERVVA